MKKYLIILFVLISCRWMPEEKFIKITPVQDLVELMFTTGELGVSGCSEVYFISWVEEEKLLKEGFVVVKLHRTKSDKNNPAYRLLDSLNTCKKSLEIDISPQSNWSVEEKLYWTKMRELQFPVKRRFYTHVRFYIEQSAVTGISKQAFLKYE